MFDQYLSGVYYGTMTGDFCRIIETDDSIGLVRVNEDTPYYEFADDGYSDEEILNELESEFEEVPHEAVADPVEYIKEFLDSVGDGGRITDEELLGLQFARTQVTISKD